MSKVHVYELDCFYDRNNGLGNVCVWGHTKKGALNCHRLCTFEHFEIVAQIDGTYCMITEDSGRNMKGDDLSSVTESLVEGFEDDGGDDHTRGTSVARQLYGRTREKLELLKAYQRVLQSGESQVVFVHGTSGQGKTVLVDTLREPVCGSNGYFCAGKFFQDSARQEAYSAITSAFSDLCDLVIQSPDFDEGRRDQIQEALGLDGHILSKAINLAPFLKGTSSIEVSQDSSPDTAASFARFRAACKTFLLAMPSKQCPVVLFIDDLQWMDTGSAKLIDFFIRDDDIRNVLFIFAYRDEEAATVRNVVESTRKEEAKDIQLSNLEPSSVHSMVGEYIGSSSNEIDELSKLVFQRTGGHPFFVSLFLQCMKAEGLLIWKKSVCSFDINKIRISMMVSENVAELLAHRIQKLPCEVKQALTAASLIGYHFNELTLSKVAGFVELQATPDKPDPVPNTQENAEVSLEALRSSLAHAVEVGIVDHVGSGAYVFTHDKLQTSFQGLIAMSTHDHLHRLIGEAYLAQADDDAERMVYNAVVHLNSAPSFLSDQEHRIMLATINLEASRYCHRKSAFDKAVSLLRKGRDLLELHGKWSGELVELSFAMTEALAKTTLLVGDFAACRAATREALLHADTAKRKANLLLIDVECLMANNEMEMSVATSILALSELGVKLPKRIATRHVAFKVMKLKILMANKTDQDILGLPPVQDETKEVAIRLLIHVCLYSLLMDEEPMGIYAALVAMDLTLKYGLSTYSSTALSLFGIAILRMGNLERGYSLGILALKMMEQSPSREADCPTLGFVNTLLRHWKEPLGELRDPLFEAASAGFDRGDMIYSTYCLSQAFSIDVTNDAHFGLLEESLLLQYNRLNDLGQSGLLIWIRPCMQLVANVRSDSSNWHELSCMSGDFMNFDAHLLEANAANNVIVTATTLLMKARLATTFGLFDMACETFELLSSVGYVVQSTYASLVWFWSAGVAYDQRFQEFKLRKDLRKARQFKNKLKRVSTLGPNALVYLEHLELKEFIRVQLRDTRTRKRRSDDKDDAFLSMLDCRLEKLSGSCFAVNVVAYKDAGVVAARMGYNKKANRYFERSKDAAIALGVTAPARWVEEKRRFVLSKNIRNSLIGGVVQFVEE